MSAKSVDSYIDGLEPAAVEIASAVRRIILKAAPDITEAVKWGQPVYESNGPFAYIKAFGTAVNFGFWRGVELNDPEGVLQGSGAKMRHTKLKRMEDIDADAITDLIRQAIELNRLKGDPSRGGKT